MSTDSKDVAFNGLLRDGVIAGAHSRSYDRLFQQAEIAAATAPTADAVFQVLLNDVLQSQTFTLPIGTKYLPIAVANNGLDIPAGTVATVQCITASGAADVVFTLDSKVEIAGQVEAGTDTVVIGAFLQVDDVTEAFASDTLIQWLDNPVNPTGTLNAALRDKLVARVNGECSSITSMKLQFPMLVNSADADNIQATLAGFALDMFEYYAVKDKAHFLEAYTGIVSGYKRAVAWLEAVRDGLVTIGTSKVLPGAEVKNSGVITSGHEGTFERSRWRGF